MALRFLLSKIGSRGFSGSELKVKGPNGLLSDVLTTCQNLQSGSSVRRLCSSNRHHGDTSSNCSSPDSESDQPRGRGENFDTSQLPKIGRLLKNYRSRIAVRIGGGNWKVSVQMPENAKLEVVGLVKARRTLCAGWWYTIILEAVDHGTREKNEYEACVWVHACKKTASQLSYLRLASDKSSMLL